MQSHTSNRNPSPFHLNKPQPPRHRQTPQHKRSNNAQNPKEPSQPIRTLPRHINIHAKKPANQIQRHQNCRQQRNLAQNLIGPVALNNRIDAQLRQMVRMAAVEHLVEMREVAHHGHDVVLDVAEVQADFRAGRDAVLVVAAFGESFDDVGFAA